MTGSPTTDIPAAMPIVVLLLGDAATSQMPVVIIAVVAAAIVQELLADWFPSGASAPDH